MVNIKEEAIHAITTLPETATMNDIMYRLYVIDKILKGKEAVESGENISLEELKAEIKSW